MVNSIFVNDNEKIKIEIVIAFSKNGNIYCELEKDKKEILDFLGNDLDGEVKKYVISIKKPNFKDITEISKDAFNLNMNEEVSFNLAASRMRKMKKLIMDWDFTGKDGEKIEVSDKNIEQMHPSVANLIGEKIDNLIN